MESLFGAYFCDSDDKKPGDIETARRHCNNRMVAQFSFQK